MNPTSVVITETGWHELVMNDEIASLGFKILREDRSSRGGRFSASAKRDLDSTKIEDSSDIESVWCEIKLSSIEFMIGAVCRPPGSGLDFLETLSIFFFY